jgi:hypothetical protein
MLVEHREQLARRRGLERLDERRVAHQERLLLRELRVDALERRFLLAEGRDFLVAPAFCAWPAVAAASAAAAVDSAASVAAVAGCGGCSASSAASFSVSEPAWTRVRRSSCPTSGSAPGAVTPSVVARC